MANHTYKQISAPGHPLISPTARQVIHLHRAVLYDKIGPGPHPCHWCGESVNWAITTLDTPDRFKGVLVVDHLDNTDSNNDPSNLAPSCHSCNIHRTGNDRFSAITYLVAYGCRHAAVELVCTICATPFLATHSQISRHDNGGKYCSLTCRDIGRFRASREHRSCLQCGGAFTSIKKLSKHKESHKVGVFCCRSCFHTHRREHPEYHKRTP
jgi:hypothetical protein